MKLCTILALLGTVVLGGCGVKAPPDTLETYSRERYEESVDPQGERYVTRSSVAKEAVGETGYARSSDEYYRYCQGRKYVEGQDEYCSRRRSVEVETGRSYRQPGKGCLLCWTTFHFQWDEHQRW